MRFRLGAISVVIVVLLAACGGGNEGDVDAYCTLIRAGEVDDLEALIEVAPPEIRNTVVALDNATRGLTDIGELHQLFAAAFDPDAQAARVLFTEFSSDMCGV